MQNKHRPFHLELENEIYFLTSRCYNKINYFLGREKIVLNIINDVIKESGFSLYAFVIISNHYHLLLKTGSDEGLSPVNPSTQDSVGQFAIDSGMTDASPLSPNKKQISRFARRVNSLIAKKLNEIDDTKGRNIFYQYWDWCIRSEKDFFKIFNYIHQNPIKHNLVKNFEELERFDFCSYKYWLDKKGRDFLFDCFYYYPANEINIEE